MKRYHIQRGDKRTTVSLHPVLAQLLAFKLGQPPDTQQAHQVVRQWLQETADQSADPHQEGFSQWLQGEAVLFISDNTLSNRWLDWIAGRG